MHNYDIDFEQKPGIQESEEQKLNRVQLNKDFFHVFSTETGQRVLEYFKKHTVDQPSWIPGHEENYAVWREGQNAVVREIEARIVKAKNEE